MCSVSQHKHPSCHQIRKLYSLSSVFRLDFLNWIDNCLMMKCFLLHHVAPNPFWERVTQQSYSIEIPCFPAGCRGWLGLPHPARLPGTSPWLPNSWRPHGLAIQTNTASQNIGGLLTTRRDIGETPDTSPSPGNTGCGMVMVWSPLSRIRELRNENVPPSNI